MAWPTSAWSGPFNAIRRYTVRNPRAFWRPGVQLLRPDGRPVGLAGSGRGAPPPRGGVRVPRLSRLLCCMFYPTVLSLYRPPEGWLRCRAPRVTCHSLLPTFRLQSWPPGVGFPYTQIETRGLRTPGGRGGLWLEKASKNTPTGVACTVASMCPCSGAGPMPCPSPAHPEWQDRSPEGGCWENAQRSRAWNLLACSEQSWVLPSAEATW